MKYWLYFGISLAIVSLGFSAPASAQSDDFVSLGAYARAQRKASKEPAAPVVIDNDNLSKIMDEVEEHRLGGKPMLTLDTAENNFRMSSPDGTCSLSFNANMTSLLTTPYVSEEMPQEELAKLEGPASIDDDRLQVTIFNGTDWNVKEITVGLTIVRHTEQAVAYAYPRLVPAVAQDGVSQEAAAPAQKASDVTLLIHLKGSAEPLATTMFRETLGMKLEPDQEWHWAIINAKGVRPSPLATPEASSELPAPVFP
ncbi:MAG TPA: hypothetical protein VFB28_00635 [Terriglobales bacterium]|nr:hypothetical protein [Terriglobales bacterium]